MSLDMTKYDALTFDVYGTLIDWEPTIISMFQSVADQYAVALSRDQLLLEFDRARAALQRVRPALLYPDVLRQAYDEFCGRYDVPPNEAEREVFANSVMLWPAFDDTQASMHALQQHFKIGLVSNIDDASLAFSTRKLSITPDVIVTAEGVGAYKPDHAHFERTFTRFAEMGISPDRILHVGQSLRADVIPANALGLACAWIKRPGRSLGSRPEDAKGARPDIAFDTMAEFVSHHRTQLSQLASSVRE